MFVVEDSGIEGARFRGVLLYMIFMFTIMNKSLAEKVYEFSNRLIAYNTWVQFNSIQKNSLNVNPLFLNYRAVKT